MKPDNLRFLGKAVTIYCTDKAKSEQFYVSVLGAEQLYHEPGTCPWFRLGDLKFSLVQNAEARSKSLFPTDAMVMLWIEVPDITAARQHLLANHVPIREFDGDQWLICEDPDGLLVEVWESNIDS